MTRDDPGMYLVYKLRLMLMVRCATEILLASGLAGDRASSVSDSSQYICSFTLLPTRNSDEYDARKAGGAVGGRPFSPLLRWLGFRLSLQELRVCRARESGRSSKQLSEAGSNDIHLGVASTRALHQRYPVPAHVYHCSTGPTGSSHLIDIEV